MIGECRIWRLERYRFPELQSDRRALRLTGGGAASVLGDPETNANPPQFHGQVRDWLDGRQKQYDVPGVAYLLAETRGEVHHFVEVSRRAYGNPFRNSSYAGVALLALVLSRMAIHQRIFEIEGKTQVS